MKGGKELMNGKGFMDEGRYLESCKARFWQEVFQAEVEYLARHLQGCKDILSVGCGPAIIEGKLAEIGFEVTGLDVSQETLGCAPDGIRTVAGRAEELPFPDASFDAVIFVASLQFIGDFEKAVDEAARVLKRKGRLIAMLLNPESGYFKNRVRNASSYVRKIRHTQLADMERKIGEKFAIQSEYFMGVKDGSVFKSRNPADAALYIIQGLAR